MSEPEYPCTDCGDDAFIGYAEGWNGKVRKGERLCTWCFMKRGGEDFFSARKVSK